MSMTFDVDIEKEVEGGACLYKINLAHSEQATQCMSDFGIDQMWRRNQFALSEDAIGQFCSRGPCQQEIDDR